MSFKLNHLVIIPDGNRRWAKAHGKTVAEGHKTGIIGVALPLLVQILERFTIHTITWWLFSTDNWNRDTKEIDYLMKLFGIFIQEVKKLSPKYNCKVLFLGRRDRLPAELVQTMQDCEKSTSHFSEHIINLAIDYSGKDEISRAITSMVANGDKVENLDKYMDSHLQKYPQPDLLIRSSGTLRLSGYGLWQISYTEFFFSFKSIFPILR